MKEKLLLKIADIFMEFNFKEKQVLSQGDLQHFIVKVDDEKLSTELIHELNGIHPFQLSIEKTQTGFLFNFKIKA